MAESSSWLSPTLEQVPDYAPKPARLPPGVVHARPIGAAPEPVPERPAWEPPPPPPLPTEAEARGTLAERQETYRTAQEHADAAQSALQRAEAHARSCSDELAQFSDIDRQLTELHVEALRAGEDQPHVVLPDELRQRVAARDQAALAAAASARAIETFQHEASVARDAATHARVAVDRAVAALVARHALVLLARRIKLASELAAIDNDIASYEQFAGGQMPRAISEFLLAQHVSGMRARLHDVAPWQSLRNRLAADPEAELTLSPTAAT